MPKVTIVSDTAREVDAVVRGERILLEPEFLQAAIGWTLKPEGLCAEGACVPVREPAALFFDGLVDLASVAAALGRSIVVDPTAAMAALSLSAAERQIALTGRAVDFTLPDLDGTPHASRSGEARSASWSRSRAGAAVATTSRDGRRSTTNLPATTSWWWPSPSTTRPPTSPPGSRASPSRSSSTPSTS